MMNKKQRMQRTKAVVAGLVALAMNWVGAPAQAAVGLSTRFVDVSLEGLQLGVAYNLRELKKVPYTIKNLSGAAINVRVEVTIPKTAETAKGYEPIPDPSWVQIVPNRFTLAPGQTGFAQVIVQVPADAQYDKRHFHTKIWATTEDNPYIVAAGVVSQLKFSTGVGPETLRKQKVQQAMMTLDFDITPQALYLDNLQAGAAYDFEKLKVRPLKVTNRSETELRLGFVSIPWEDRFPLGDYEKADPAWMTFKSTQMAIAPDTISAIQPVIRIPNDPKLYGKKLAFLVKTELVLGVELEYYNRVYVTVKDPNAPAAEVKP